MDGDLARTIEFLTELFRRTSTRTEPFEWGTAFFHDGFPKRYDSNFLLVERPLEGVSARALSSEADRILAELGHREIVVAHDASGERLAIGLGRDGYSADHLVVMAQRRRPDRDSPIPVEEVDADALIPLVALASIGEHPGMQEHDAWMLAEFRRVLAREVSARFFIARVDGEPASYCELYTDGVISQVEDVNTLERHRGRGLARAVVLRAAREARASGADLVFLHADTDDWPKQLYAKLGFDPIGHLWSFVRVPDS